MTFRSRPKLNAAKAEIDHSGVGIKQDISKKTSIQKEIDALIILLALSRKLICIILSAKLNARI
jgi:hypothetical protein